MPRSMRVSRALFVLCWLCWLTSIADAGIVPTASLHLGGSYTVVHDEYAYESEFGGVGPGLTLSVGARVSPQWSASAFAAFGQLTKTLEFENAAMDPEYVRTTYRHVMLGGRVTWRPLRKLLVGAALGRAFVTEIDRFGDGRSEIPFRSTLAGIDVGVVLYEHEHLSAQLSIGILLGVDPGYDHAVLVHVPFALGLAWN